MKNRKSILLIFLVILFALLLARDPIIKSVISLTAQKVAGAAVRIDGFSLSTIKSKVSIRGFRMYNPKGFPSGVLVNISKVGVDYDLPALIRGRLHLRNVGFALKEVSIIKSKEGKLNVDALKVAKKEEQAGKKPKQLPMQIDVLNLQLGRVIFTDYTAGDKPSVQVYNIGVNRVYKNITSAQQLTALILSESLKQAGIKSAGIYGVSSLAGVAILPVGVAAVFTGKDSASDTFEVSYDKAYKVAADILKKSGELLSEDKQTGWLKAKVSGSDVAINIIKETNRVVKITVSAREFLIPKPQVAAGVLYQISEKLE